jgi:acyl-CoA thioesterase FadM
MPVDGSILERTACVKDDSARSSREPEQRRPQPKPQGDAPPMSTFNIARTVLFGDCDPAGAIYTPRIAHYVVEAVLEFQSHILGAPAARTIFALGVLPPARELNIEFLAPLTFDDAIHISVTVGKVGETSFTCNVEGSRQDGQLAFRARLTQVCVSPETKRPAPLPAQLRHALSGHRAA